MAMNLYKWQIICTTVQAGTQLVRPPCVPELLSAALLATVSRFGTTKSVVMPRYPGSRPNTEPSVLHIWILNSNVRHASTFDRAGGTAIKLAFSTMTRQEADAMLESMTSGVQEVNFPQDAIDTCVEVLQSTNQRLSVSERRFMNWDVSLLGRYGEEE